ncbi:MAG: hypothetical protein IPP00_16995 [Actinomycetales bacterium]|uniref:Uncharacterized protein n=1 Tax=Candidatus Phosphoribacter hodrii TaxID=2953743 RepID=A0A9D7TEI8_9MICO|nr:hypothetical protein [Candidatus Phosphoribacter hodrii]
MLTVGESQAVVVPLGLPTVQLEAVGQRGQQGVPPLGSVARLVVDVHEDPVGEGLGIELGQLADPLVDVQQDRRHEQISPIVGRFFGMRCSFMRLSRRIEAQIQYNHDYHRAGRRRAPDA